MNREPISVSIALGGTVSTAIALAAVLWPERLTPELQAAIIAFANALILTGSVLFARARATPTGSPSLPIGTTVDVDGGGNGMVVAIDSEGGVVGGG